MKESSNRKLLERYIFPDAIVYCGYGFSFNKPDPKKIALYDNGVIEIPKRSFINAKNVLETLLAFIYTLLLIVQIDQPKYITKQEFNNIKNMESERYRQNL
jgi:hypothetical protein